MLGAHADAAGAGRQLRLQGRRLAGAAAALRASACARARRGGAAAAVRRRRRHAGDARRQGPGGRAARSASGSASRSRAGAWHAQRDDWVALGCEVAVLCGSLGKIGRDLALLAQAEVGEVAEPAGAGPRRLVGDAAQAQSGRGDDRHRRGARARRITPRRCSRRWRQAHERGLGDWQAELAEWPSLFIAAHGAVARPGRRLRPASRSTPAGCATTSSASAARSSPRPPRRCSRRRSARRRRTSCWRPCPAVRAAAKARPALRSLRRRSGASRGDRRRRARCRVRRRRRRAPRRRARRAQLDALAHTPSSRRPAR